MSLLPVDTDALKDICRDVAMSNYGFLYVTDKKGELQSAYESADTGTLNASDLSSSDLRDALREASSDEFADLEARIAEVRATTDRLVDDFDEADYAAAFRDVDGARSGGPGVEEP